LKRGGAEFDIICPYPVTGVNNKANEEKMKENLDRSLMLATALNPYIGYENAAKVVKKAYGENITLKKAAAKLGLMDEESFDRLIRPDQMV